MVSGLTSSSASSSERKVARMQEQVKDVDRDLEDARERVRFAERAQWSQISYSRRGDTGRTVAIVAVIAAVKRRDQKNLKRLQAQKLELQRSIEHEQDAEVRRQEDDRRREEAQGGRLARLGVARGRNQETEEARAEEKERIERSRARVRAEERRRGLSRDHDEPDHDMDIGI